MNHDIFPIISSTIVTILLAARAYEMRRGVPRRLVRGHLSEMRNAWLLVTAYYCVKAAVTTYYPSAEGVTFLDRASNPSTLFFVSHGLALLFGVGTNHVLHRSITYIKLAAPSSGSESPLAATDGASIAPSRGSFVNTIIGIVCLVILLLAMTVLPAGIPTALAIALMYLAPLVFGAFLFFRLARLYWEFDTESNRPWIRVLAFVTAAYGALQLMYVPWHLVWAQGWYFWILHTAKLTFAFVLLASVRAIAERAESAPAQDPVDVLFAIHRDNRTFDSWSRLLFFATAAVVVSALSYTGYERLRAVDSISTAALWSILTLYWVFTLLVLQLIVYLTMFALWIPVSWKHLESTYLKNSIRVRERPDVFSREGWSVLELRPPEGRQIDHGAKHVILLHGIFGDNRSTWGLLPVVLLESGHVSVVSLVSYRHALWSGRTALEQYINDFPSVLDALTRDKHSQAVLIAHSLGCLMSIRAIATMASNKNQPTSKALRFLDHVVCVGPPLLGSFYAVLGFPWRWPTALRRGSGLVRSAVNSFGAIWGREASSDPGASCSACVVVGSKDDLIGATIQALGMTRLRKVPGGHSLTAVFDRTGYVADLYRSELTETKELEDMDHVRRVLEASVGARMSLVFSIPKAARTASSLDLTTLGVRRMKMFQLSDDYLNPDEAPTNVSDALHVVLRADSGLQSPPLVEVNPHVRAAFEDAIRHRGVGRVDFSKQDTMYVFATRRVGYAIVVNEGAVKSRRRKPRDLETNATTAAQ